MYMQFEDFYEVELYKKSGIISIVGPAVTNKKILASNLIKSIHDRTKRDNYMYKFSITIFSHDVFCDYNRNMGKITINSDWNKLKDYYLIKKYYLKKNKSLDKEILLFDDNVTQFSLKNKYFQKILANCKKLNLVIIMYSNYFLNFVKSDFYLLLKDDYSSSQVNIYKKFYKKVMSFDDFKTYFREITKNEGIMIFDNKPVKKLKKLARLYDADKERRNYKRQDPNYDVISDESGMRFF